MKIKGILNKVRRGTLTPGRALNKIQDIYIKKRRYFSDFNGQALYVLECLAKKEVMTVAEAEEDLETQINKWLLGKTRARKRGGGICPVPQ